MGEGYDCKDAGGRVTQEQLPREGADCQNVGAVAWVEEYCLIKRKPKKDFSRMRPERVERGEEVLNETRSGSIVRQANKKFGEEEIKITSLIKGWSQE